MRECQYCAEEIEDDSVFCRWCGSEFVSPAAATTGAGPVPAESTPAPSETRGVLVRAEQAPPPGGGSAPAHATVGERQAIGILKALAWVVLVLGTLGGIVVMAQASQTSAYTDAFGYSSGGSSGFLVGVGLGMIIYSVLGWAFLLVLASMATNLMEIRENTRR